MSMCLTTNLFLKPKSLEDFGLTSDSNVSANEFSYGKESEIYGDGEPADYVYQVKTGAVRSYKLLSDGRRQINAFHLLGDVFGLENGTTHRFTTEAVVDTTLLLIKRRILELVAENDAIITGNLLRMFACDLARTENHLLLLGRQTALERVGAFLVEMDKRLNADDVMTLPMVRRDIADYLGLTVETVSRALAELYRAGLLQFLSKTQREIVILDRKQLALFDIHAPSERLS
jgi:CRP/FNR family transcriptional regulator, nitrogen fixation regulation protein